MKYAVSIVSPAEISHASHKLPAYHTSGETHAIIVWCNPLREYTDNSIFDIYACNCCKYETLILQPFSHFTYVTTHCPTLPSLYLRHSSFSNPSVASPTSQLILQPFFCFSYVIGFSLTSPGEPPMVCHHFQASNIEISTSQADCYLAYIAYYAK